MPKAGHKKKDRGKGNQMPPSTIEEAASALFGSETSESSTEPLDPELEAYEAALEVRSPLTGMVVAQKSEEEGIRGELVDLDAIAFKTSKSPAETNEPVAKAETTIVAARDEQISLNPVVAWELEPTAQQDEEETYYVEPQRHLPTKHFAVLLVSSLVVLGGVAGCLWLSDPARRFEDAPVLNRAASGARYVPVLKASKTAAIVAPVSALPPMPELRPAAKAMVLPAPAPAPFLSPPPAARPVAASAGEKSAYEQLLERAKSGSRAKRIELLRSALGAQPQGQQAMTRLAFLLMEGSKTQDEALALAERSLKLDSTDAQAWLIVGYIRQLRGEKAESKAAYTRCSQASKPAEYARECKKLI